MDIGAGISFGNGVTITKFIPSVPGAPTIGTALATSGTTATVAFTAPASDGGATITTYTATSSPGGITGTLSQAGSGTITVSGLTGSTSYTFTVTATNSAGTSSASSASNTAFTAPTVIGQAWGGGYYAGQISTSGNGVANYYIVVAPASSGDSQKQWKTTNTSTSNCGSDIEGPSNSTNNAFMNNANHPAAYFCAGLTVGGYTDWYMPAKNELEVCFYNLKPYVGGNNTSSGINPNAVPARASYYTSSVPAQTSATAFRSGGAEAFNSAGFDGIYFSSTQFNSSSGWTQGMYSGYQRANIAKTGPYRVRAMRRLAV
jgi:hypothetical protein